MWFSYKFTFSNNDAHSIYAEYKLNLHYSVPHEEDKNKLKMHV